jgi:hypothetical protein
MTGNGMEGQNKKVMCSCKKWMSGQVDDGWMNEKDVIPETVLSLFYTGE